MGKLFKALTVFGIITSWILTALADGKVTLAELAELLQQVGEALGIKELRDLEIELPDHSAITVRDLLG